MGSLQDRVNYRERSEAKGNRPEETRVVPPGRYLNDNSSNPSSDPSSTNGMVERQMHYTERWRKQYAIKNVLLRNLLAEFYATALLRFIGTGVLAQFVLGHKMYATIQINIGWGFAIAMSVYSAWKTSGGHINPAVTAVLFILGKISFLHSCLYCVAQTLGAAFGAALSYGIYYEAIDAFDHGNRSVFGGPTSTGNIFASFPFPHLSNTGAFFDQMAGTGLLGLFVAFFCEHRNEVPNILLPAFFGICAAMIGVSYSMNMGSPVNPASDLGPRIFAALYGYGWEMFTYQNYFFWVPVVAPIVGAVVGAYSYIIFVGLHVPDPVEAKDQHDADEEKLLPIKHKLNGNDLRDGDDPKTKNHDMSYA